MEEARARHRAGRRRATANYKYDEDELGEFLSDTCVECGEVKRKDLFNAYKFWAGQQDQFFRSGIADASAIR
jgi:phage/plasmid-associated DNA primase